MRFTGGPVEGERPSAYIIMLGDTSISTEFWCDHGISGQSILLGAREKGIAGCFIGAILVALVLIFLFPALATFLPKWM